jgi:hypothetical protein
MIIAALIGVLLFVCAFLGFRQGLRLGMQAGKGQVPPKLGPKKETKGAEAELMKGYYNMMSFTGDPKNA